LVAVGLPRFLLKDIQLRLAEVFYGAELVWLVEYSGDDVDGDGREVQGVEADADVVLATLGAAVGVSAEKPRSQLGWTPLVLAIAGTLRVR
jgi:hypothetical protein